MPSVAELLTTIKDQALVGAGDLSDDERVLRYMNLFHKEIWRTTAKAYPSLLRSVETVNITNGQGALATKPFAIMAVKDQGNGSKVLKSDSEKDIEKADPSLSATGRPNRYYMTSETEINTYPKNDTTLYVRTVPRANTLDADSTEDDLKVPPEFHDMYVWGTIVYMTFDERDKAAPQEINIAQSKYEACKADYTEWLAEQGDKLETEASWGA